MNKLAVEFRLPSGVVRRAVGREAETVLAPASGLIRERGQ